MRLTIFSLGMLFTLFSVFPLHAADITQETVVDFNVNMFIKRLVDQAKETGTFDTLSDALKRCYEKLSNNYYTLPAHDVWQALPEILEFALSIEQTKAWRPNAPWVDSAAPVVGPASQSMPNVQALLQLLVLVKNKIGAVNDDICCNTILGILGNACDILDCSIACTLTTILSEIRETGTLIVDLADLEATLSACCNNLSNEIDGLSGQVDALSDDVFDLQETVSACCSAILQEIQNAACCDCDFFITQNMFVEDQLVITEPGVYCLAEDVAGSIVIETSNVTLNFKGHTLTATGMLGILSTGNDHISIYGGTIEGNSFKAMGIGGSDITIDNMTFSDNAISINLFNVNKFTINNCTFHDNSDIELQLDLCTNGSVTNCLLSNSQNTGNSFLITVNNAQQLLFERIVVTDNLAAQSLTGIQMANMHESTLNNIQMVSNAASSEFTGLVMTNCDDNTIKNCTINKNSIESNLASLFVGIDIAASTDGGSKNNHIMDCQLNDNNIHNITGSGDLMFAGINLATPRKFASQSAHACENCSIQRCSVNNNQLTNTNPYNWFVGINVASSLDHGNVGAHSGRNCLVEACTVNNNQSSTNFGLVFFIGINIASIVRSDNSEVNIHQHAGENCAVRNCSINNNAHTSRGTVICEGVSIASVVFGGELENSCGSNIVIDNCAINGNTVQAMQSYIRGVTLAGTLNTGIIGTEVAQNCVMSNCSVLANSLITSDGFGSAQGTLVGINVANADDGASFVRAKAGSQCSINNIIVQSNALTKKNTGMLIGINLGESLDLGAIETDVASSSMLNNCAIVDNICTVTDVGGSGFLVGVNLAGFNMTPAGNDCRLENIEIARNAFSQPANNGFLYGFNMQNVANTVMQQCLSLVNTGTGFKLLNVTNSTLTACNAFSNTSDGFAYDGTTNNVTTIECQSLGNETDGFHFALTTTQCFIRNNVAQNNSFVGFNNVDNDEFKHQFLNNFAQANGDQNYVNVPLVTTPAGAMNPYGNIES